MESGPVVHGREAGIPGTRSRVSGERLHMQQLRTNSLELTKVIHLLEDPLTANLKERHLNVLKKLLKRCQIGFILKELAGITKILNICAEKVKDHPEYVPILCEALKICRLPFLKERTSDELNYAKDVIEFLSHMGCLMRVPDADVRQQIVETVRSFYSCVAPEELLDGTDRLSKPKTQTSDDDLNSTNHFSRLSLSLQSTSPGFRLQLLEQSDLAQTLLLSMATLEYQTGIKLQVLRTLQLLSSSSDRNCILILNARGAETICLNINEADSSGQILLSSCDILWNLLERGSKDEVAAQLSSMECVTSLKEAFLNSFGFCNHQRTNDLLMITTIIAENLNSLLVESSFAKQLVAFATFPELKSLNPLVQNIKFNYSTEELIMKKLLLNLLAVMSKDSAALQLYKEERIILALLTLMKPPDGSSLRRSGLCAWSASQQEELQLQALATLASIAPLVLDNYMSCQGNTCLLLLLDWCVRQNADVDQGNSVHGAAEGGIKKAQIQQCMRVLRSVMSLGEEAVSQDLCDQGIINQLLGILVQMEANPDEDDAVSVKIKSDIQLILSVLCDSDMHRKELFGSEGVEMVIHFLKKGSSKFYSGLGHNKLILTTVDCVWSCIVGCYTTEDYFLAKEGLSLLLDLLSSTPRCVHCIILTTMLELCDNPNTLSHILSWRGEDGHTAPRLLLQLWREEEVVLMVNRSQLGGIVDPCKPILSLHQQEERQLLYPANMPSAAVLELSENLRAKIYCIFCKLGFQDLPGLSAEHYVTLSIVRKYLDFKVGEVWEEISRELSMDGVRPISPDAEALSTILKITEDTAKTVAAEQNSIIEQQKKEELSKEETMYTEIKSRMKQQQLIARSWDSYVSRTSSYGRLKEVKAQREMESSRPKPNTEEPIIHPSEHFIGQIISMETTDAPGPEGVKLTMGRTHIKPAVPDNMRATKQDPEYFNTMSVNV